MRLVDLVSQETGEDFAEIMLLRHTTDSADRVLACGGSVDEWTSIQPPGTKYDYHVNGKPQIRVLIVIVRDSVFAVYRVLGVEAEGNLYSLASKPLRQSYIERNRVDKPARRFTLERIPCAADDALITGWKGKEISPVLRSSGKLFWEIEVNLPIGVRLTGEEASGNQSKNDANYVPQEGDQRAVIERQIRERRGQKQFRNSLRDRYADCCLVTGCEILAVLEAAHIKSYRGEDDHHTENGLLLRADIHTLFDLDLIGIEPDTLRVELHPSIVAEYGDLAGNTLGCNHDHRPSHEALKLRYEQFQQHIGRPT